MMNVYAGKKRANLSYKFLSAFIAFTFGFTSVLPPGYAQTGTVPSLSALNLPAPGAMVTPSSVFVPTLLDGVNVHADNSLEFDFIISSGDDHLEGKEFENESRKLVKYFLAALTIPEKEIWVNLSPYETGRIIPQGFGSTEMGRDMLAQDYILKQLTASLMYPENNFGKEFWDRVYKKTYELYGTTEIPMNTFNKVWVVPDKAVVFEHGTSAFVVESYLKVMLEEDYNAMSHNGTKSQGRQENVTGDVVTGDVVTTGIIREVILPEIEKEVNTGKHFSQLRQMYNAMILATWYKDNLRESLLGRVYVNRSKTKGIDVKDSRVNEEIYQQYLEAFRKGVYNYIREDYVSVTDEVIPRKYFSGGAYFQNIAGKRVNIGKVEALNSVQIVNLIKKIDPDNPGNQEILDQIRRMLNRLPSGERSRIIGEAQRNIRGRRVVNVLLLENPSAQIEGEVEKAYDIESSSPIQSVFAVSKENFRDEMNLQNEPTADMILISAGGEAMSHYYDGHFEELKGVTYRKDVPVISIPDPALPGSQRVGNGGAIGNTLLGLISWLETEKEKYPHLKGKELKDLRIVLIQAGGFGMRYTPGSSDGSKTLMPVPVELPNRKQASMMDFTLMYSYKFTRALKEKNQGGLVVLNGDGLLITEPKVLDGISLITNPESIQNAAGKLGVVAFDLKTGEINAFFEKPDIEVIRAKAQAGVLQGVVIDEVHKRQLQTNTASFVVTHSDKKTYDDFLTAFLSINDLVRKRIELGNPVYEIDTSGEYFIPLTVTKTAYLAGKKFLPSGVVGELTAQQWNALEAGRSITVMVSKNGMTAQETVDVGRDLDKFKFYGEIYDMVRGKFPKLYATAVPAEHSFYKDYGDVATWYTAIINPSPEERIAGFADRVNATIIDVSQVLSNVKIYRSSIGEDVQIGGEAVITGSRVLDGSRIGRGSVVYNVRGAVSPKEDTLINMAPIKDAQGNLRWALLYVDRDIKFETKAAVGGLQRDTRLYHALEKLKERGLIDYEDNTGLMTLPLWPLQQGMNNPVEEIDFSLVEWMGNGEEPSDTYVNAPKVSFGEITKNIDYRGVNSSPITNINEGILTQWQARWEQGGIFQITNEEFQRTKTAKRVGAFGAGLTPKSGKLRVPAWRNEAVRLDYPFDAKGFNFSKAAPEEILIENIELASQPWRIIINAAPTEWGHSLLVPLQAANQFLHHEDLNVYAEFLQMSNSYVYYHSLWGGASMNSKHFQLLPMEGLIEEGKDFLLFKAAAEAASVPREHVLEISSFLPDFPVRGFSIRNENPRVLARNLQAVVDVIQANNIPFSMVGLRNQVFVFLVSQEQPRSLQGTPIGAPGAAGSLRIFEEDVYDHITEDQILTGLKEYSVSADVMNSVARQVREALPALDASSPLEEEDIPADSYLIERARQARGEVPAAVDRTVPDVPPFAEPVRSTNPADDDFIALQGSVRPDVLVPAKGKGRSASPVGGIDLDPALLDLQIRRDGNGVPLPVDQQPIEHMRIDGFIPVIIHIRPLSTLPMILGAVEPDKDADDLSFYRDAGMMNRIERFSKERLEKI